MPRSRPGPDPSPRAPRPRSADRSLAPLLAGWPGWAGLAGWARWTDSRPAVVPRRSERETDSTRSCNRLRRRARSPRSPRHRGAFDGGRDNVARRPPRPRSVAVCRSEARRLQFAASTAGHDSRGTWCGPDRSADRRTIEGRAQVPDGSDPPCHREGRADERSRPPAAGVTFTPELEQRRRRSSSCYRYLAYSTARVSRITVTLIWPG